MKIVTEFIYPPIPDRRFDWAAHYDDPEGSHAFGRTEQEAIQNLVTDHSRCKEDGGYVGTRGECLVCDADAGVACRKSFSHTGG